ncbi:MAG: phosphoribosyltransferase family protein [Acidobacteriota bacterium]
MFADRTDAGQRLARELQKYRGKRALILAIPRGGVEVAFQVARHLRAEFSLLVSRKLPYPDSPEAGFGAVAEDGSFYLVQEANLWLTEPEINRIKQEQVREIQRRIKALRKGKPLPRISGRTVILVDDGLAVGSTMKAAVMLCRNQKAGRVVVAVPVAGGEAVRELREMADEVTVLEIPPHFQAVAQAYRYWTDVTDEEVTQIMKDWQAHKKNKHKETEA